MYTNHEFTIVETRIGASRKRPLERSSEDRAETSLYGSELYEMYGHLNDHMM